MEKNEFLNAFSGVESSDNFGLLGYSIMSAAEEDGYSEIGKSLLGLINNSSEKEYRVIELAIIAICGWSLDCLIDEMRKNTEFYDSL